MIHIITQFILLINLLQLGYLKSKITFHPFVSLYNNHTLHHLYKKATKTDRENDLTLFENRKTEGCRHANFFQKKLYLHQIILLINLLQLGRLKSQTHLSCCTTIILYITHIKRQQQVTVKKDLKLFENRKTKGRKSLSEKIIFTSSYGKNLIYNYEKRHTIFTPGATLTKLYHTLSISASKS